MVRKYPTERTFEQRPRNNKGANHVGTWEKTLLSRGNNKYRDPEAEVFCVCTWNSKEAHVAVIKCKQEE